MPSATCSLIEDFRRQNEKVASLLTNKNSKVFSFRKIWFGAHHDLNLFIPF
jgi:hypothetical protein